LYLHHRTVGKLLANIKSGYSYSDKREELEALGVVFKVLDPPSIVDFDFDTVFLALGLFRVSEQSLTLHPILSPSYPLSYPLSFLPSLLQHTIN
jgi:hypothetical protein